MTASGKIDDKALRAKAAEMVAALQEQGSP